MKKIILLSLVCLSTELFAQKSFFGVDAGINVANQRQFFNNLPRPIYYSSQNVVKPSFGVFYQYGLLNKLAIRTYIQYMGMGYQKKYYTPPITVDIQYLTVPVSIIYLVNDQFSLSGGAYLSFTLGGTRLGNQAITKTFHKNDFGIHFGGEQKIYKNLSVSINYFIGTKNVLLDDQRNQFKNTNRALQFTLIYKFKKPVTAK